METAKERNKQIYEERKTGLKYAELQEKYNISVARLNEICMKEAKKERYKKNDVYSLLISLCDDDKLIARTFTVLKRIGATSEEEILKLDRNILKKTRNCGPVMQDVIMKMKEAIEKKYVS